MYTKEQNDFLIKHYHDEAISYRNEINKLTKNLQNFVHNENAYNKLTDRIKELIIKRNIALDKLLEHRKLADELLS